MDLDLSKVDEILKRYPVDQASLIPIMQDVQNLYNYLPRKALEKISDYLHVTISKIYGVATFYENFSLDAKGKYIIRCCDGTACHVRKSTAILNEIRSELGVTPQKNTTDDMMFTVETVSCLGACGLAPVMVVGDEVHPAMTVEKVKELLASIREKHSGDMSIEI
ncbi:MAG: NAD(P)H-dependent oxidoreductase subunit E [Blautia sp.]|nr:NAD(P)H-dependent oxidoreductase subunit E [Blautia sp.]